MPTALYQETPTPELQAYSAAEPRLVSILTVVLFLGIAAVLIQPIFSHASWLIFVQDDLLYYLKVAQNIAQGHGSTFNGIVPTNGYQPLWLACLVLLSFVTENPRLILTFLAISSFFAAGVVFALATRLLRLANIRPLLIFVFAAATTLYSVTLFFYGMEVTLAVPFIFAVVCTLYRIDWLVRSPLHTFALGLLLSGMVLSRIDTLIFGGLLLAGILLSPSIRQMLNPRLVLGAIAGLVPLIVYFLSNRVLFHTWMPVSGMAKQIKFSHAPSPEPWKTFLHPVAAGSILVLLIGISLLPAISRRLSPIQRVSVSATLFYPFLYYTILSFISDWPLWGWYAYPIRPAICISFLVICLWPPIAHLLQKPLVTGLLVVGVFSWLVMLRWTRQQVDIYAASVEIQQFAQTHPGVYAMGDRAGRPAVLISDPIVQTEGLMMDRPYLDHIRNQDPLRSVLAQYGVRYYIGTAYLPFTGCFHAVEPAKAGPDSAHMRADFCETPVATYHHDGIETLIYDLAKSPAPPK